MDMGIVSVARGRDAEPTPVFAFPLLKSQEILKCMEEASIPLTEDELKEPNRHRDRLKEMWADVVSVYHGSIILLLFVSWENSISISYYLFMISAVLSHWAIRRRLEHSNPPRGCWWRHQAHVGSRRWYVAVSGFEPTIDNSWLQEFFHARFVRSENQIASLSALGRPQYDDVSRRSASILRRTSWAGKFVSLYILFSKRATAWF